MKKQSYFKAMLITGSLIFVSLIAVSQNYEASKSLNKSAAVPADVNMDLSNHSGDINITTTSENRVSIQTELKVSAKSKEDADKLIKAIEDFEFELNGKNMKIDTRFYKSMQSINGRSTITLNNGDKIKIKDFEIRHEVSIPKSASLNLENKYSTVVLETIDGKANLNLYSSKLKANDFAGQVKLESKYSKLQVENFKDNTTLDLYDTDIQFKTSVDLKITSKYSKVEASKTGTLLLNSYDDKFYIDEIADLSFTAKYSDLKSEANINSLKLELYDSNVLVGSAKAVTFNGKYCNLNLGDVENLKIDDSYDNDITFGKTSKIEFGKSKYSKYIIDENSSFTIDDSHDDNILIKKLNSDFSGISINAKYGTLKVGAGSVPFKVDVTMKYGKVDLPSSVKLDKHIDKDSKLEVLGGHGGGTIKIRGYDVKVTIE